jgi:FeS assembly SUF system protein
MFSSWFAKRHDSGSTTLPSAPAPPEPTEPSAAAPPAADVDAPAPSDVSSHGLNVDALFAPPPVTSTNANAQPEIGPADPVRTDALKPAIVEAISTVFDPEIPVNIYELGLIYEIVIDAECCVGVRMTLTSPACPSAQQLPSEVRYKVKAVEGVTDCAVDVVWEPPWTKEMMSEAAKLSLGLF